MNRNHSDHTEIPHHKERSRIIHWNVVSPQKLLQIKIRKEKKQHKRGHDEPSVNDSIAALFVERNEQNCHDDDDNH